MQFEVDKIIDVSVKAGIILSCLYILTILFNSVTRRFFTEKVKMLMVTGLIGFSICAIMFAAQLCNAFKEVAGAARCIELKNLSYYLVNSFVNTLQTFSLDYEYDNFWNLTKLLFGEVKLTSSHNEFWQIYASLLYILAPITGGAILFEIIASIFPRFKLFFSSWAIWREIIYFSELNEQSLALAENIKKEKRGFLGIFSPYIIVFTDVYTQKDMENSQELYLAAKKLGAICLSDDILHIRKRPFFKKKIFLIDFNEVKNLQALSVISENGYLEKKRMLNSEIYLFSNNDTFALIGSDVNKKKAFEKEADLKEANPLLDKIRKRPIIFAITYVLKTASDKLSAFAGKFKEKPSIITINGYKNAIRNLFSEVALYEPLINRKKDRRELNLTILGAGEIGMQIFLSAYWYGQILGYKLCINVVSKESASTFFDRINEVNPDIFNTCEYASIMDDYVPERERATKKEFDDFFCCEGRSKAYKDIMRMYPGKEETSEPYFKFRYYCTDVKTGDFRTNLTRKMWSDGFCLADSDYFTVTLGSDTDNLTVADKLKRMLCEKKLADGEDSFENTVIAYVIYDSALCEILNGQTDDTAVSKSICMRAFGSMAEVFATKNIFMESSVKSAKNIKYAYDMLAQDAMKKSRNKSQYDYWANVARSLHIKYKVFSAGCMNTAVFGGDVSGEKQSEIPEDYRNKCSCENPDENLIRLRNELAWLEHRRWNAFMRVCGFKCPEKMESYLPKAENRHKEEVSHKNIPLRLHPCIVECDKNGLRKDLFSVNGEYDLLDCASLEIYQKCYGAFVEADEQKKKLKELENILILEKSRLGRYILRKTIGEEKEQEKKKNKLKNYNRKENYKEYDYPKYDF